MRRIALVAGIVLLLVLTAGLGLLLWNTIRRPSVVHQEHRAEPWNRDETTTQVPEAAAGRRDSQEQFRVSNRSDIASREHVPAVAPRQVAPALPSVDGAPGTYRGAQHVLFQPSGATNRLYDEPYTRQISYISVNTNLFHNIPLYTGETRLVLGLFPNATYTTVVERVQRDANEVMTISGRINGEQMSTFTLAENGGRIIATLTDMANGRVFRIKYVAMRQEHVVTEYDPTTMPARYDEHLR